jgi:hypothetical protein
LIQELPAYISDSLRAFFWNFFASFSGKKSRIQHFVGLVGGETERERVRGLYIWQSRWCWRAVSRWILLSILRELFLLFSESQSLSLSFSLTYCLLCWFPSYGMIGLVQVRVLCGMCFG